MIGFFAAERMLRRLGASPEVQQARSALHRLPALLPEEVVIDLGALEDAISFAPEPVLDVSPEVLRKLATAARHRQTLHIHYYSQYRAEYTERDVDVLILHNALGEWYAICYDHYRKAIRDFHAGRIMRLSETSRTFTPPADWDPQAYGVALGCFVAAGMWWWKWSSTRRRRATPANAPFTPRSNARSCPMVGCG